MFNEMEKKLQVPMSELAYKALEVIAAQRGFKSRAAYVRNLIARDAPELQHEFETVEWGGNRRPSDDETT